jgi:CHAT domain-containing protein
MNLFGKKRGYLSSLLIDKGDAYQRHYIATGESNSIREAIRIYKIADQFLDRIKTVQYDLNSKLFWRSDSRRLYEHAIEACFVSENSDDAFYFFEKSRAVLLSDHLNEQRWLKEDDIRQQTQLRKKIRLLEKESGNVDIASTKYRELQNDLFRSRGELDRLTSTIKTDNPLYYQSFIDTSLITIQTVRRELLTHHQALLEIFTGDSLVYVLTITADQTKLIRINKSIFDALSMRYTDFISNPGLLNKNFSGFLNVSRKLYELIFRSIDFPTGRVIISPDGQYFPFESLVTSNVNGPLSYFLYDHSVSYAYSARYLMNKFLTSTGIKYGNFLGIAPVLYPYNNQLTALKGSDQSLMRVKSYFSFAKGLVLEKAVKKNFLQQFSKYKIVQLYSHASDSSMTGEPVIYFADSALYLSDLIGDEKPVTNLVVLSACETGMGEWYRGEGVFSFNRGFAAMGIPSSVMNIWSVDNYSTYKLTELFYKYLAKGMEIDIALQKAKMEFLETASMENQLPYYWAAMILAGKTDPVELKKTSRWNYLIVGVSLAGLLAVGIWVSIKKKKSWRLLLFPFF